MKRLITWLIALFPHRCRSCRHYRENFITAYSGTGLYRFGFCSEQINDTVMVDGSIKRKCREFIRNPKKNKKFPENSAGPEGPGSDDPAGY